MKTSLHIALLTIITAISILVISVGAIQSSSINIVDQNPSFNVETMAGSDVDWSWYVYNNNSSPIFLSVNVEITQGGNHISGQHIFIDGLSGNYVQINPQNGATIKVVISTDRLSSTSSVDALVTLSATNLVNPADVDINSYLLQINISSLYSGEDSYNKIMGFFTNSLPTPLDNAWGALLITLMIYVGLAITVYLILLPLVLKMAVVRDREIYRQVLGILRGPVFILVFFYGLVQSFYIVGADEPTILTVNMIANIIYIILAAKISWALYKMFARRLLTQYNVKKNMQNDMSFLPLLNWMGKMIVILGSVSAILSVLGFNIMVILTGAGILGLAISLGAQDTLNKFFSGLSLLIERPFKEGDLLQMDDGVVVEAIRVGLRSTTFYNTFDPQYFTIPNDIVANSKIVNVLRPDARYKAKVDIGVAYGSDIALVKKAMLEAAMDHPEVLKTENEMPMVRFMGFGDSSLNFRLFTWVNDFRDHYRILGDLRESIDGNFRKYGIVIPFPQRDIWIRENESNESDE